MGYAIGGELVVLICGSSIVWISHIGSAVCMHVGMYWYSLPFSLLWLLLLFVGGDGGGGGD